MQHNMRPEHPVFCSPCDVTVRMPDCLMDEDDEGIPVARFDFSDNVYSWERIIEVLERGLARAKAELAKAERTSKA